jgi:hypothetical protein
MAAGIYLHSMVAGLSRFRIRPVPTAVRIAADA